MCQASEKRKGRKKKKEVGLLTCIHVLFVFFLLTERAVKAEYRSRTQSVILEVFFSFLLDNTLRLIEEKYFNNNR